MSLTDGDVRRLELAGHHDFCRLHDDGTLRLRNINGRCIFLENRRCAAYSARPVGCVLYPLIWYTEDRETGLHEFCPHRHEFRVGKGDRDWLARSIASELTEVDARVRES